MPLKRCEDEGRPGWKWGDQGTCYVFTAGDEESETAARKKALAQAAAMGEFPGTGQRSAFPTEIFHRSSIVDADTVDFTDRIIEVVAVPWDVQAPIVWRGELWHETFQRGAFNDAIKAGVRIPVNREHVRGDTVGRVVSMVDHPHGLLASVKIAKTARGDDTLQLAAEGVLGASVGYQLQKLSDVILNKQAMTRRVVRAFMEHLGMTESPAFAGADTIAVHDEFSQHPDAGKRPLNTPTLDEMANDEIFSWATQRLGK